MAVLKLGTANVRITAANATPIMSSIKVKPFICLPYFIPHLAAFQLLYIIGSAGKFLAAIPTVHLEEKTVHRGFAENPLKKSNLLKCKRNCM